MERPGVGGQRLINLLASYKGSISAEHGIGAMKTDALCYSKTEVSIAWMKKLKHLFDPRGIMNPGKVIIGATD